MNTIEKTKHDKFVKLLQTPAYDFLRKEPLGDNILLLGLGGSHAYGTSVEGSDVDVRGVAGHSPEEILTRTGFEQVVDTATDTTVYSLEKIVTLLTNCNPNVIELLGLEPWQYLYVSEIGQDLIDNADMFLSKKAVHSFGGYANAQLRRLENKSARNLGQAQREKFILASIENAKYTFPEKYFDYPDDAIRLYVDRSDREEYESEIFMDIRLTHYPLRDYKSMWNEMHGIVKEYAKVGARNKKAIEAGKLSKHMMHLVRLYLMCFDILEEGKIRTCRAKERDFLMDIRNGKYLGEDGRPIGEFYQIVDDLEARLDVVKEKTELPENPDYDRIRKFLSESNYRIIEEKYGK